MLPDGACQRKCGQSTYSKKALEGVEAASRGAGSRGFCRGRVAVWAQYIAQIEKYISVSRRSTKRARQTPSSMFLWPEAMLR